jgi:hypothetical protein
MSTRPRFFTALLAASAATVLILLAAAPVGAAPSTGSTAPAAENAELLFQRSEPARSTSQARPPEIFCFLDVDNPRGPTGNGSVQTSAFLICTYPVDFITLTVELYLGSTRVSRTQQTVAFALGWGVTTTAGCVSGSYTAIAEAVVVPPRGYSPPVRSAVVGAGPVNLTCGAPPNPGSQPPFGNFDTVDETGAFRITGWAIDPDTTGPTRILTWFCKPTWCTAGTTVGINSSEIADKPRPDVGAAYPEFGPNHGFDTVVFPAFWEDLAPGVYDLCVDARNLPGGNGTRLGCRPVTLTPEMVGPA